MWIREPLTAPGWYWWRRASDLPCQCREYKDGRSLTIGGEWWSEHINEPYDPASTRQEPAHDPICGNCGKTVSVIQVAATKNGKPICTDCFYVDDTPSTRL